MGLYSRKIKNKKVLEMLENEYSDSTYYIASALIMGFLPVLVYIIH